MAVAAATFALQLTAAAMISRPPDSPNASTQIARHLVATGEYAMTAGDYRWRAFQLPGEPLYIALGLIALPPALTRYLHVIVTTALVIAVAWVGWTTGGSGVGLVAGSVAAVDPFVLRHGAVWDDAFLSAALLWLATAIVASQLAVSSSRRPSLVTALAAGLCAGLAAVTRLEAALALIALAVAVLTTRDFRPARRSAVAMLLAVAVGLGAWALRNKVVLGHAIVGTTHDGQTLWHSNSPDARSSILQTGVAQTYADMSTTASGEVAQDLAFRRSALSYIAAHPVDAALTASLKIAVSMTGYDFARPVFDTRHLIIVPINLMLVSIGTLGLVRSRRVSAVNASRRWLDRVAMVLAGVTLLGLLCGPVGLRYRIALAGLLYIGVALYIESRRLRRSNSCA